MDEWVLTLNNKIIKRFTISEGQVLTIGRGSDADVVVDNTAISRQHSSLELKGGIYYLTDLYSLNGTKVNGEKIESAVPIAKNDTIEIGKFRLQPADTAEHLEDYLESSATPDLNDETIFVSSKARKTSTQEIKSSRPSGKAKNILSAAGGQVAPATLMLEGKDSVKIGKDPSCDMVIQGFWVAKAQFYIISRDNKYFIVPQSSWAKTRLNGTKIKEEHQLRKGDLIEVGSNRIRFD